MGCIRLKQNIRQNQPNWGCRDTRVASDEDKNSWCNGNGHNLQIWLTTGHSSLLLKKPTFWCTVAAALPPPPHAHTTPAVNTITQTLTCPPVQHYFTQGGPPLSSRPFSPLHNAVGHSCLFGLSRILEPSIELFFFSGGIQPGDSINPPPSKFSGVACWDKGGGWSGDGAEGETWAPVTPLPPFTHCRATWSPRMKRGALPCGRGGDMRFFTIASFGH